MKKELSFVLNYALNKGFQIHPNAFKILDEITDVKQLENIIKEIVKEKTKQKLFQINQNDLETYLGIKDDPNLQNEMKYYQIPLVKLHQVKGLKDTMPYFLVVLTNLSELFLTDQNQK